MNKRLLFIGGGAFTVLLALFAFMSVEDDNSNFTKVVESSFLSLEHTTIL